MGINMEIEGSKYKYGYNNINLRGLSVEPVVPEEFAQIVSTKHSPVRLLVTLHKRKYKYCHV
jgi:hypothetical protein